MTIFSKENVVFVDLLPFSLKANELSDYRLQIQPDMQRENLQRLIENSTKSIAKIINVNQNY